MEIDNETYWIVKNTTGASGFLGGLKPTPLPEDEVKNVINLVDAPPPLKPKPAILFDKEESVRIIEGPFANFIGIIEEVNEEKGKLIALGGGGSAASYPPPRTFPRQAGSRRTGELWAWSAVGPRPAAATGRCVPDRRRGKPPGERRRSACDHCRSDPPATPRSCIGRGPWR